MTEAALFGAGEFARQASVEAYRLAGAKSWETVDPELTGWRFWRNACSASIAA